MGIRDAIILVIDKAINPIIIVGGIAVLVFLIMIADKLKKLKQGIDEKLYGNKQGVSYVNPETLALEQRKTASVKREALYPLKKEFNDLCSKYLAVAQFIPIFPLLGILGTVAGLMQLVTSAGLEQLYGSLDIAMSSTLYGLIAAIVLKAVEAAVVVKTINDIETMLNDYEIKFQDSQMLQNKVHE